MPWQSNSGGGGPWGGGGNRGNGGGQSPWGSGGGSGGGGGQQPPDVEKLVREGQEKIKKMLPGDMGGMGILVLVLAAAAIWMLTGIYRVQPEELGVELVFGKFSERTSPGLHYNFPAPIGEVIKPQVTRVNQVEVGFRSGVGRSGAGTNFAKESLMLTGDENIIDVQFAVFWRIADAQKYVFNIRNPEPTVKDAAEAAMREIIGKSGFEYARTSGRGEIAQQTKTLIQSILDDYGAGIEITNVNVQKVDPPSAVIEAFRDVQAARADQERVINEAQAYRNEVTEKAQGRAEQLIQAAEGYKGEKIAIASGDASRFLQVYEEYRKAKDITKRRIYLETMEKVLGGMDKVLIEEGENGSGVLPYLPLNELTNKKN
ncbi:FtsH protease activity modulator HflK [Aestuariispira insulae]|uniref:Protein HflK n=1 Tax=Aestuariispira insulae TaxID=1461337 RepID=A0A3D9HXR5_9PROT|nr:FtsH protease activity modulator HflK [Aestuariispira insulae]RED54209.1 protease FtsH subunit HflK [Aestuariispira insulae]